MEISGRKNFSGDQFARNISRLVFVALVIFELLNVLKIIELNIEYTWLGLLLTAIFSFIALETVALRYQKIKGEQLHWSAWLIIATALSLDAFGDFFHLFGRFEWWDRLVHFGVSSVVCFAIFIIITSFWLDHFQFNLLFKTGRVRLALFISATSAISLGVIYEIEEYLEDILFASNRLGPGVDTVDDLLFNFLGILLTVGLVGMHYFIKKYYRKIV